MTEPTDAAALRTQLAELRAKREDREAAEAPARELERLKRELRDEQALESAIAKHGRVGEHLATVDTPAGLVIVCKPSTPKFRRFQDLDKPSTEDVLALLRPCVVWPPAGELDVLLNDLPAALSTIAQAVIYLAGQRREAMEKK